MEMIVWSLFITWYTWKGRPDTLKGSSEKKNKVAPAEGKYCKNGKSFMMNLYTINKKTICYFSLICIYFVLHFRIRLQYSNTVRSDFVSFFGHTQHNDTTNVV